MNITSLFETLNNTENCDEIHDVIKKLNRCKPLDRSKIIDTYLAYMLNGKIEHWRSFIIPNAIELIEEGESQFASSFESALLDPDTAYWALAGLEKTLQKDSIETLLTFALDSKNEIEDRAHAIKLLAKTSNQTFIRGLPDDPGHWKEEQLPIDSILDWKSDGCPDGEGFSEPTVHPSLSKPVSKLDALALKLEKKLSKYRKVDQNLANPSNWLVPADEKSLSEISKRWELPIVYQEFLERFSPLEVTVRGWGSGEGIQLFGADELIAAQNGYSYDPVTEQPIDDWEGQHLVIASKGGDPFVLDLGEIKNDDCPVLTARHGEGKWVFNRKTATFLSFLKKIAS